ncbi:helix-turn-helix domain-containing protein [Streptomyces sp. SL13]|uniref:Helix-turn-helix domain-containing protein n=1 Tax=Streptantibioticus silvisoli TaxID=2705255 RepID=A0AA90H5L4_9ACTN|nr:transcriptional regulator [Streptantibioticus silvisoli]MDI5968527.1 helix-turn-helix domain-containing protein [Streptantibioticus silvisoli]
MEERVSEPAGARENAEFARLLRELKDRSGLSYGVLAKRLHTSTSTLHRYCNGTVIPGDYAPVERLARVCRATPKELVDLHRRWVLADAVRGLREDPATVKPTGAAGAGAATAEPAAAKHSPREGDPVDPAAPGEPADPAGSAAETEAAGAADAAGTPQRADAESAAGSARTAASGPAADVAGATASDGGDDASGTGEPREPGEPFGAGVVSEPGARRRRRTALIASVAVAAVLGTVVLVASSPWGAGGSDARDQRAVGATASSGTAGAGQPSAVPSPGRRSRTPSASASVGRPGTGGGAGASRSSARQGTTTGPAGGSGTSAAPPSVEIRPYVYDSPCSQHFLVDQAPGKVGPPADEQDAPRWAAAYGAVSSGEQEVALTVQGAGANTVVLEALHVRVLALAAPLAWNDYSMGVGCGGNVATKSFAVDLDEGSPMVTVQGGQRDFPYSVSESDPEVFYVVARTTAHDVRWDLSLDWSSGSRHGTVLIDDHGTPFRTSADAGRPGYDYPLGGDDWIKRVD